MSNPITTILQRGHAISIHNGKLEIVGDSSRYTDEWYRRYSAAVIRQWSEEKGLSIYSFTGFTVGNYEFQRGSKTIYCPGCRLQLFDVNTGEEVAAIFNVELKYSKSTHRNHTGTPYKGNRFRVGKNHALYRLWVRVGLPEPRRPSELYKGLGKLKGLFFTGSLRSPGKLDNKSIRGACATSEEISALCGGKLVAGKWQGSGKEVASAGGNIEGQALVAEAGGKELSESTSTQGQGADLKCVYSRVSETNTTGNSSTCPSKYELSDQVMKDKEPPSNAVEKAPQDQTDEEWFLDYDNAS